MSVLKKIGLLLVRGGQLASEILGFPFISELLGAIPGPAGTVATTVVSDISTVAKIISTVEALGNTAGLTGSQKLAAGAPLVQQALLLWADSNLPGHNKVKDPVKLATAASGITSNFADFLNALGD